MQHMHAHILFVSLSLAIAARAFTIPLELGLIVYGQAAAYPFALFILYKSVSSFWLECRHCQERFV